MALVDRKIYSIAESLDNHLAYMKNNQRGIIEDGKVEIKDVLPAEWQMNIPPDCQWQGVTYGNDLYVAISDYSRTGNNYDLVMKSTDGDNWTIINIAPIYIAMYDIVFGNGLFIAVGMYSGNRIITSSDADIWTLRTVTNIERLVAICYGGGYFVAISSIMTSGYLCITYSSDSINWITPTGTPFSLLSIAYGNGIYVALGLLGVSNPVYTSTNRITWINRASIDDNIHWKHICYGIKFVVVGDNGIMHSVNGIDWTEASSYPSGAWGQVAFGGGIYVAMGINSNTQPIYSTNGDVWDFGPTVPIGDVNLWRGLCFGEKFVAVKGQIPHEAASIDLSGIPIEIGIHDITLENHWCWKYDDKLMIAANTKKYDGSWEDTDAVFKQVKVLKLTDSFVTTGIAIGESGETALVGFKAISIVGALNELRREFQANWQRDIIDATHSSVKSIFTESEVKTYIHCSDGLIDNDVTYDNAITIADSDNINLHSWYRTNSLLGCFNQINEFNINSLFANRYITAQIIPASTETVIIFNQEVQDTFSAYIPTAGFFVVNEEGNYIINTNIFVDDFIADSLITIKIKSNTKICAQFDFVNGNILSNDINCSLILKLNVSEVLHITIECNNSCKVNNDNRTNFNLHKFD